MTEIELETGERGSVAKILRWVIGLTVLGLSVWILAGGLSWQAAVDSLLSGVYGRRDTRCGCQSQMGALPGFRRDS